MKDYILELVSKQHGLNAKLNTMREYLQAYALKAMAEEGAFRTTAFVGGTALRFLYDIPRFSEDLDFSVVAARPAAYPFERLIKKVKEEFASAGYNIGVTYNDKKNVISAFLKFDSLMYEAGISPLKDRKLSIKLEIDTNPPAGAAVRTDIVNKYFPLSFLSYDIGSLFAGKLHALMSREYAKGRDFFDLGWYLSRFKNLKPNVDLLQNALKQTGWKKEMPAADTWRSHIKEIVMATDWKRVRSDVQNFLENPADFDIFSKENILMLIENSGSQLLH